VDWPERLSTVAEHFASIMRFDVAMNDVRTETEPQNIIP